MNHHVGGSAEYAVASPRSQFAQLAAGTEDSTNDQKNRNTAPVSIDSKRIINQQLNFDKDDGYDGCLVNSPSSALTDKPSASPKNVDKM